MSKDNVHVLDFENVRTVGGAPTPVAAIRVQISESLLDTAERVSAYLRAENGAVSAKLHDRLPVIPLSSAPDGSNHDGATDYGSKFCGGIWRSCGGEVTVDRDGYLDVEMAISSEGPGEVTNIERIRCCMGTVGELRALCQDSAFAQPAHEQSKCKIKMRM
jgi:hypothetical protein